MMLAKLHHSFSALVFTDTYNDLIFGLIFTAASLLACTMGWTMIAALSADVH
jgi:hypothetical protein